jgi:gentisate 1,2-dioxygenase
MRAGELTPVKKAEHRVLFLVDPGRGAAAMQATSTLYVGFQLLMPCETAPAHKHTPSAARVVVEGEDAYTVVDGNRSDLCKRIRSCSIISVPGSTVTKRASGVASGILVHRNHWAAKKRQRGLLTGSYAFWGHQ